MTEDEANIKLVEAELEHLVKELEAFKHQASKPPFCSFCGAGHNTVAAMLEGNDSVTGRAIFICSECIAVGSTLISSATGK